MIDISELVAGIPELSGVKHYELLNSGVVNETWQLFDGARSFVLRRDTPMVVTLGLDRKAEIDVLGAVAETGLGPKLIWADLDAGLLLTEYIEGYSWSEAELSNNHNLLRAAELFYKLHHVSIASKSLKPIDLSECAWRYAEQLASSETEHFAIVASRLADEWCSDHSRHVLCHNDLICSNIIAAEQGDDLMLIDWEYAGLGEPYFDLAVFLRHHSLSDAAAKVFLDGYSSTIDEQRMDACMAIYDRLLVLWLMLVCKFQSAPHDYQRALDTVIFRLKH
jgi:thiamine kinase